MKDKVGSEILKQFPVLLRRQTPIKGPEEELLMSASGVTHMLEALETAKIKEGERRTYRIKVAKMPSVKGVRKGNFGFEGEYVQVPLTEGQDFKQVRTEGGRRITYLYCFTYEAIRAIEAIMDQRRSELGWGDPKEVSAPDFTGGRGGGAER